MAYGCGRGCKPKNENGKYIQQCMCVFLSTSVYSKHVDLKHLLQRAVETWGLYDD